MNRRVLVVGGGPAGSTTAFWLGKAGFEVVVAERNAGRPYGQGLDITGSALDVVRKMGLERRIRASTTKEGGFALVDDKGGEIAAFDAPSEESDATFVTQEIEILRGELTRILASAAEALPSVTYRYGCDGRAIWMRPIDEAGKRTSCMFLTTAESPELQRAAESADPAQQKAVLDKLYRDFDGLGPRTLRGMHACTDFHFARIVQVKLPTWHTGRIGLVGDAAYCPSPLTGQGTTLALLGAYVLAGEMLRQPDDPRAAFTAYERQIGDFVRECQQIPLGGKAPRLAQPQTAWGVWTLRKLFRLIMSTQVWRLFQFGEDPMKIKLPRYEWK